MARYRFTPRGRRPELGLVGLAFAFWLFLQGIGYDRWGPRDEPVPEMLLLTVPVLAAALALIASGGGTEIERTDRR